MIFTIVWDYYGRLAVMQMEPAQTTEGPSVGPYGDEEPMWIQRNTRGKVRGVYIPKTG